MKVNYNKGTGVESNVETKSLDFGIGDPAMVIEILRKRLYSNPIQTLVQEYISNGRDACREAGLPERIVVTIPTPTNKVFKVRDYGVGISPDRIANVFINYCSSTKRDDNSQTGGFGIGAKSAWAYTDNFTIVSYYNGVARHYTAHIGAKNSGSLDLINETPTSEPNGTEIQIAVCEYDMMIFERAVYRCTFFWKNRPEIRGIPPAQIPDWYKTPKSEGSVLDIGFYTKDQLGSLFFEHLVLVVDGIPYELPRYKFEDAYDNFLSFRDGIRCAIPVKTGEVEVSASRESLSDNPSTRKSLSLLMGSLTKTINKHVETDLGSAACLRDFLAKYKEYYDLFEVDTQQYKEYVIDAGKLSFAVPSIHGLTNLALHLEKTKDKDASKYRLEAPENSWSNIQDYEFIYCETDLGKATLYNKVRTFLMRQPESGKRQAIVLFKGLTGDSTVFDKLIVELKAINISDIELDKKTPSQKRPDNELIVTMYDSGGRYSSRCGHVTKTINLNAVTKTSVYVWKSSDSTQFTEQKNKYRGFANMLEDNCDMQFYFVAKSSLLKLEQDPNFISYEQFWLDPVKYLTSEVKTKLTKELITTKVKYATDKVVDLFHNTQFLSGLKKIQDKEFVESFNFLKDLDKKDNGSSNWYRAGSPTDHWGKVKAIFVNANPKLSDQLKDMEKHNNIMEKYPLIDSTSEHIDDLILYLNAKYESMKLNDR